ncbi:hypothetical protein N665_1213s0008 [Sinapis alba]|nr:hypothetical protein N665_1213s0008 [Sinapis alba]
MAFVLRSLRPSPPSERGRQTTFQETLAAALSVMFPFHKNREHKDSTALIQPLGRTKDENQKFKVLVMTEESNWRLPAKESAREVQEEKRLLSWSIRGL